MNIKELANSHKTMAYNHARLIINHIKDWSAYCDLKRLNRVPHTIYSQQMCI